VGNVTQADNTSNFKNEIAINTALRRSEEQYRALFESIDEGFCIIEILWNQHQHPIDYRFLEINAAFERHTGLVQAQGKTARELLPDLETHWIEIYGNIASTGEPYRFENGSDAMGRWFDVFAFRFGAPELGRVAIRFKDITERKAAEVEREQLLARERSAREEAEQANRMKDPVP
jgi:PAS domain S-box-containing protein